MEFIMNILIIEDEIHNQRLLTGMISEIRPAWNIVEVIDSVADSIAWLSENEVDLIFMDIQLVDGSCFSIFDKLTIQSPVIFTTAFDNYALQAFKVNSIDYLLKPIKETDLKQAILKFEQRIPASSPIPDYAQILEKMNGNKRYRSRILIHGAKSYYKIDVHDVAYFYSDNKITFARTFNGADCQVDMILEVLEEELNPESFFRAGRNILLHIDSIISFEDYFGGKLVLKLNPTFNQPVTVSRLKNMAFKKWVGK